MGKFKKEFSFAISIFFIIIIFSSPLWAVDENSMLNESQEISSADDIWDCGIDDSILANGLDSGENQTGSYTTLDNLIKRNNVVELDRDYEFNSANDSSLQSGIVINKKVTIDGKGFTITSNDAKIFYIKNKTSLTLKNVIIIDNNSMGGYAIENHGKLIFENVTFTTQKQATGGIFNASILNDGEFSINNSNFADSVVNYTDNKGLSVYGLLIKNFGNLIMDNSVISKNGLNIKTSNVQIYGGMIHNSGVLSLNNVNMTDSYCKIKSDSSMILGFILGSGNASDINIFNCNFDNNIIVNNATSGSVMANVIKISDGTLNVYNSEFINNTGSLNGGAIGYNSKYLMVIENSLFDSNSVEIQGGAIFISGNLISRNNTFRNNFAGRNGGAVYVYGYYDTKNPELGNVISTNDVFEYNWVESSPDAYGDPSILSWGGAICSKAGNLTLINDTFYKNKASMGDGGAIANYLSSFLEVSHCIFKENEATRWDVWTHASGLGGAILIPQTEMVDEDNFATFNIEYSIFDNNIAIAGSALYSVPYQNVPCDFISNNNYWGTNNPFFRELIGKYQLSDVVFPDNYVIMEIEGNESAYINSSSIYRVTLNNVNENGVIKELDDVMPDWQVKITSSLNPLSNSTLLISGGEAAFGYDALSCGLETFSINNRYHKSIQVIKYDSKLDMEYNNIANGVLISISLSGDINDEVYVEIGGETYSTSLINGSARLKLPKLPVGNNTAEVSFGGNEKYNKFSIEKYIVIEKNIVDDSLITHEVSNSNVLKVNLPKDATGKVLFDIDGMNFYSQIQDGVATLDISSLGSGVKNISWVYLGDANYDKLSGNFIVNIAADNIRITSNDMKVFYTDGSSFRVQVLNNGKPVGKGKSVSFRIDGRTITALTDEGGYASFAIGLLPKTYSVTISCDGVEVKNTITVKNVLFAKNLSKKKAKKIKYTVKLKGKKALKGKKVIFKINGKKYSSKTNKKGIATVYLKNLKVGKHKIVIKYANLKVTKTIKIKK